MPKKIIFLFIILITICGCRKDALEVNADLVGKWNTEFYSSASGSYFTIAENGDGVYVEGTDSHARTYTGKAKIGNDVLKIGKIKKPITGYPDYDSGGNLFIELNGSKFVGCWAILNPTSVISGTTADLYWDPVVNFNADFDDGKSIDYKPSSSTTWTTINFAVTPPLATCHYQLSGLSPLTTYDWKIKSTRGTHSSAYTSTQNFITQ